MELDKALGEQGEGVMGKASRIVYDNGIMKIKYLSDEEVEPYREMPVGFGMNAEKVWCVSERDGEKRIIEQTADGVSAIRIMDR